MKTIGRLEDMSAVGRLILHQQDDGDVIVEVIPQHKHDTAPDGSPLLGNGASVEFCASGGRSTKTLHALRALMAAMAADGRRGAIPDDEIGAAKGVELPALVSVNGRGQYCDPSDDDGKRWDMDWQDSEAPHA
jgi:hypothetical protein